ncbi:MAG: metal ABC transporter permease [Proteobacteria bacterium]|nr:metal ABC transporter permease [Pseudomonadota bacterium]
MDKLILFFESWEFFQEAAISGLLAGSLLGAIGIYILLGRMVFLSAALSQTASAGVAFALWLPALLGLHFHDSTPWYLQPILISFILTLCIFLMVSIQMRKSKFPDALLAALYLGGGAATILIGKQIVHEIQDVQQLLVGNAVLVDHQEYIGLIAITAVILSLFIYCHRGFEAASFGPDAAQVAGIPVTLLNIIKFVALVLAITYTTRMMGAMPVFALSCLPAVASRHAPNVRSMFYIALFTGAFCGFGGYIAAFIFDFPVGPTQAALALLIVILSELIFAIWRNLKSHHSIIKENV